MVAHAFNSSIQAYRIPRKFHRGEWLWFPGQPGLESDYLGKIISQNKVESNWGRHLISTSGLCICVYTQTRTCPKTKQMHCVPFSRVLWFESVLAPVGTRMIHGDMEARFRENTCPGSSILQLLMAHSYHHPWTCWARKGRGLGTWEMITSWKTEGWLSHPMASW